jgi:ubiquinone/menaquinone biosynthesis C-methylase UbiE
MITEAYTPGHTQHAVGFISQRRLNSHGAFLLPPLKAEMSVLDCGCGPGTITLDIARIVKQGQVVGVFIY